MLGKALPIEHPKIVIPLNLEGLGRGPKKSMSLAPIDMRGSNVLMVRLEVTLFIVTTMKALLCVKTSNHSQYSVIHSRLTVKTK